MGRAKTKKKIASKLTSKVENRIVELSLKNPDFGSRRLVSLMKQERISVSASQIYNILKRHGLQNRARRLAKLKEQTKKTKSFPKKVIAKIPYKTVQRIVEVSLQNPDLGARRLSSLLKEEEILVSTSSVYTILKRNGLQTRAKRLVKLKEKSAKAAPVPKKPPTKITSEVEERIVELSLKHPDLGARRLVPLLEQEGILITASAIYSALKRNGLQNRSMRKLRLEAQQALEAIPEPEAEKPPTQAIAIPTPEAEPAPVAVEIEEKIPPQRVAPVPKAIEKVKVRRPWFLTICNILLLLLLFFLGFYTWQHIRIAGMESETVAAVSASPADVTAEPEVATPPLNDFSIIWERNLFNLSEEEAPAPKKEIAIEKIALAQKDLGLKLVGTVVADDPNLRRAFIDNRSTREQEAYREGDQAGKVLIKKVLRNKVVITTDEGDKLLTVEIEESTKRSNYARQIPGSSTAASQRPGSTFPRARSASISVNREEVEAALADTDQLLQELTISPYLQGEEPAGFRIGSIPPQSALRKMGLRSRDVIVGVNDEDITSPDQASEFFRTLGVGGEVTIKLKRRRRTRQIKLDIE